MCEYSLIAQNPTSSVIPPIAAAITKRAPAIGIQKGAVITKKQLLQVQVRKD